jgi:hypothetical protein
LVYQSRPPTLPSWAKQTISPTYDLLPSAENESNGDSPIRAPAGFSRFRSLGREAHDGFINPTDTAWDGDFKLKRDPDTGKLIILGYKRRFCGGCKSIIRRGYYGFLYCSECGRIFTGGPKDWPIITRYIRSPKK